MLSYLRLRGFSKFAHETQAQRRQQVRPIKTRSKFYFILERDMLSLNSRKTYPADEIQSSQRIYRSNNCLSIRISNKNTLTKAILP